MNTRASINQEIVEKFGLVPGWMAEVPDPAFLGFWRLMADFYLAETKIPGKYKDLIGLAVSGATRCRYCALFHTEGARLQGATDEEIAEASLMGGVTMLGSTFLNAQQTDYEQFTDETRRIVAYVKQKIATNAPERAAHAK